VRRVFPDDTYEFGYASIAPFKAMELELLLTLIGTRFAHGHEKQSQSLFASRRAILSACCCAVLQVERVFGSRHWSRMLFAVNESTERHRTGIGGIVYRKIPE